MANAAPEGLVYACLTHVPLWVDFPEYVLPLYMGDAQAPGRLNVRDLAPEWDPYRPAVGSTVGVFALKNYILKNHPTAKIIGLCQYRRFVSRRRIGVSAENFPVMDVISKAKLAKLPLGELMSPEGMPLLLGRPARFDKATSTVDYLYQYGASHFVEDFLRFTAEAVALGVLPKDQVHPYFSETVYFPGGIELGCFPADFWIGAVTAMEKVTRSCIERYPPDSDAPRARIWGLSMERLGSWMLLEYLRTEVWGNDWNKIGGHLNLVTDEETTTYVPGPRA